LGCFFVLAFIGAIILQTMFGQSSRTIVYYELLPGCFVFQPGSQIVTQWHVWVTFLTMEGVLMLLTVYKLFSYRKQIGRTIAVLARDSFVYFIIVFACIALILSTDIDRSISFSFQV